MAPENVMFPVKSSDSKRSESIARGTKFTKREQTVKRKTQWNRCKQNMTKKHDSDALHNKIRRKMPYLTNHRSCHDFVIAKSKVHQILYLPSKNNPWTQAKSSQKMWRIHCAHRTKHTSSESPRSGNAWILRDFPTKCKFKIWTKSRPNAVANRRTFPATSSNTALPTKSHPPT